MRKLVRESLQDKLSGPKLEEKFKLPSFDVISIEEGENPGDIEVEYQGPEEEVVKELKEQGISFHDIIYLYDDEKEAYITTVVMNPNTDHLLLDSVEEIVDLAFDKVEKWISVPSEEFEEMDEGERESTIMEDFSTFLERYGEDINEYVLEKNYNDIIEGIFNKLNEQFD